MSPRSAILALLVTLTATASAAAESAECQGVSYAPRVREIPANLPGFRLVSDATSVDARTALRDARLERVDGAAPVNVPFELRAPSFPDGSLSLYPTTPWVVGAQYRFSGFRSCRGAVEDFTVVAARTPPTGSPGTLSVGAVSAVRIHPESDSPYRYPVAVSAAIDASLAPLFGLGELALASPTVSQLVAPAPLSATHSWRLYVRCYERAQGELAPGAQTLTATVRWPTGEALGTITASASLDCTGLPVPTMDPMLDGGVDARPDDAAAAPEAGSDGASDTAVTTSEAGPDGGLGEDVPRDMMARGGCSAAPHGDPSRGAFAGLAALAGLLAARALRRTPRPR